MKLPSIKLVFDRKHVADDIKDPKRYKKGLVQIEIYHDGKKKYVSTGVKLFNGQWDINKGGCINHPDSFNVNRQLQALVTAYNEKIAQQAMENECKISVNQLVSNIECQYENKLVTDIMDDARQDMLEQNMSYSTVMQYNTLKERLKDFGVIKYTNDLTYDNIEAFDHWMRTKQHYSDNTVWGYHCKLRRICNILYAKDILPKNPYKAFKLKRAKEGELRYLTQDQLDMVKALHLTKPQDMYARDFFLFQCYTGMSCIDVLNLLPEDIEERNGKHVVINRRIKTLEQYSIVIMDQAWEILQRHGGVLNEYTMSRINILLHDIGNAAIGCRLTTHMGRHTFATWALSKGVPIEYVSKMLGHTNIQTTQRYAKVLAQNVIDQFDILQDALDERRDVRDARIKIADKRVTGKKSGPKGKRS